MRVLTARTADRHALYEKSVQSAQLDAELITRIFKREVGRPARTLREDFCGTAWLCAEWVKLHRENKATGLDFDREVLAWGKRKHIEPLGDDKKRVTLLRRNVLTPPSTKFDAVCAYNYSYFIFKTRDLLKRYYRAVAQSLVPDGLFFLDAMGGPAAQTETKETRKLRGFVYEWDQVSFNPIDHHILSHIHFEFPDRTRLDRAFTYDWRLWPLPEIRDILLEAGFKTVDVYWENEDARGRGIGTFRKRTTVDADESWNAYMVARKG